MSINHRRLDVTMTQKFLYRSNIVTAFEQMRGEGMPEGVARGSLHETINGSWNLFQLHWNPSKVKWRFETHCYGPRGCPRYKAGPPYRVPGRSPGMVYVDDDVESAARGK
jgi:hypothetical protein